MIGHIWVDLICCTDMRWAAKRGVFEIGWEVMVSVVQIVRHSCGGISHEGW